MKLKQITYKNFMSIGNNPITVYFDKAQTTIIGGMNGSGKSSTLEAITYALTGKTLKKTTLPRIINKFNKKNLLVTLDFESNGNDYQVVRGMKPAIFEIYRNGTKLEQDAATKDLQSKLEFITGVDYNSLTQMIVLNLERFKPFMEMTSQERRTIVEDILNISVFGEMVKLQKNVIKDLQNSASDVKYSIDKCNGQISSIQLIIDNANKSNATYLAELEQKIQNCFDTIENYVAEKNNIVVDDVTETHLILKDANSKRVSATAELHVLMNEVKTIEKSIKFFENGNCPTCEQNLPNSTDMYKKFIHDKECVIGKSEKYVAEIEECNIIIDECNKVINDNTKQLGLIAIQERNIAIKEKEVNTLMAEYEKQSQKKDDDTKSMQENIESLKMQIVDYENDFNNLNKEIEKNKIALDILGDSGVKLTIIKDYIDFINYRVNDYLNGMEFFINITLDESFNESFSSPSKEGMIYADLSTGQKRRVNLAIWLALIEVSAIKNSVTSNVLFLDEILENMDSLGIELFIKLIKDKMPNKNVFIITQRFEQFRDLFQSEIYFNLVDGFTEMKK